jgi:hypothetical protein
LNKFLRKEDKKRLALDALAFSGAGSIGLRALHRALELRALPKRLGRLNVRWELFERFEDWADELWNRAKDRYSVLAVRDRESMNLIAPHGKWPHGIKLRVRRGDDTIGWAVVSDNKLFGDPRFGDLRVGGVVDCFAAPEDAGDVVRAAFDHLADRRVDIVISNQAHPAWANAFAENGFLVLPNKRIFAASPQLFEALQPFDENKTGLHMTNMDGHGPHAM